MTSPTPILLTGGAGYIGSHTYVALMEAGYQPVILDDFSNSDPEVLQRLQQITGREVLFERGNARDGATLRSMLTRYQVQAVIHFAGFKAVGESVAQPLKYFENNLGSTIALLQAMAAAGCHKLVFSSSATVYGDPASVPITESFPRSHTNPYGHTKLVCEDMIAAQCHAEPGLRAGVLRYFNPVGAHPSGLIGEDPSGIPNNLMPFVTQVAVGKRARLQVFGSDYATPDGTGVRDYIHVQDLAQAHVAAVRKLLSGADSFTVNVGTGQGYSVLDVVRAFEEASGKPVPYDLVARRPGDVAQCYADATVAKTVLGWEAVQNLQSMCEDSWRWQSRNPDGYRKAAD
ncbi:MAG: UDP-glucose 4-epimerase GalE [Rhodoferax sp.]|uniref:UDP-glucose 4-epimerase GalE n=1 Tax=Rhodoferax sp. TaxID=50421 RepID=UPI002ACE467B|nr:UDP-glucose 4-epimerase GalE [Rhodoferax sp.]MDZ7893170.1 UDP-glucose 4-epimerase GalE [Rhodoferax sp.]